MIIQLDTRLRISAPDVDEIRYSVPRWDSLIGNPGFVRHDVRSAVGNYPPASKVDYDTHVAPELARGAQDILCFGARDAGQNLLKPAYSRLGQAPLLCRPDEPIGSATYMGFIRWVDGQLGIRRVRFDADAPQLQVRLADGEAPTDEPIDFVVCGQALLADRAVAELETLAAQSYDLRHVWHLPWEEDDRDARAARAHERLMSLFMQHLGSGERTRGAVLCHEADRLGLSIQSGYLMSGLGIRPDGGLVLVVRHGTMQDLGLALREEGATDGILLDEGGSCGIRIWTRGSSRDIGGGTYFRPKGHSTLVVTLARPYVDTPFRRSPEIDWQRMARPGRGGTTYLDSVEEAMRSRTGEAVTITFDDPYGPSVCAFAYDAEHPQGSAAILASHVLAHGMLTGTRRVSIDAPASVVEDVRLAFAARFDRVQPGAGLGSGSATDYLTDFSGTPFTISGEPIPQVPGHDAEPRGTLSEGLSIGLDIGNGEIKGIALYVRPDGTFEDRAHTTVATRPSDAPLTAEALVENLRAVSRDLAHRAGARPDDLVGLGVTFPAAVRQNRISVPSNLLREAVDLWVGDELVTEKFDAVAPLANAVARDWPRATARLLNDGIAVGNLAVTRSGRRNCLFIQAGTSLAGAYVDDSGRFEDYLTELGRIPLDVSWDSPRHPFSEMSGLARQLASNSAILRELQERGISERTIRGEVIHVTRHTAGAVADHILRDEADPARPEVEHVVRDVGRHLGRLVRVCARHVEVEHVVLSGGLFRGGSVVGEILVEEVEAVLAEEGEEISVERFEERDTFAGARGVALAAAL